MLLLGLTYAVLWFFFDISQGGRWSALHSLLFGYLLIVAPLILGKMAYTTWPNRRASFLHGVVFYASTGYYLLFGMGIFWVS